MSSRVVSKKTDWKANENERYFLFTDGSFRPGVRDFNYVNILGLGAEMRDKEGKKVLVYAEEKILRISEKLEKNYEIIALENALDIVSILGVKKLVLQTDMKGMAKIVGEFIEIFAKKNEDLIQAFYATNKFFWHSVFDKVSKFEEVFIEYIPRELNKNADYYSRSALTMDKESSLQKQNKANFETMLSNVKAKTPLFDTMFSPVGVVSLYPANLSFMYVSHPKLFTDKNLFIEIIDDENKKSFIVKTIVRCDKKCLVKPAFYQTVFQYEENKELAFLFLLMNLVTEKSSLKLLVELSQNGVCPNIKYSHDLWTTFAEMKSVKELFGQFKKSFYLSEPLKELLDNSLRKRFDNVLEQDIHNSFMKVMHTHKKIAPLNLIDCREMWKKSANFSDGENYPAGWFFMKHNSETKKIKSEIIRKKTVSKENEQKKAVPGFSFLEYGKSLREKENQKNC